VRHHLPYTVGAWRSLVAHLLWEQGVGGSNPLAPTISFSSFTAANTRFPAPSTPMLKGRPNCMVPQ
jgi:hypothetical protein